MNERSNILTIVVIIAIVVAGGFFLLRGGASEATPEVGINGETMLEGSSDVPLDVDGSVGGDASTDAEPSAPISSEEVVIAFTEDGYEPKEVTVKKGTTVRFENKSSRDTWPASAFHPTHTVYPEKTSNDCLGSAFDACRGLAPGESWSFTFNDVGSWGLHDHLNASKTGKVIVTE